MPSCEAFCCRFATASPRLFCALVRCATELQQMSVRLMNVDKVHEGLRPSGLRGMIATIAEANGLRGTIKLVQAKRGFGDLGNPDAVKRDFDLVVQGRVADVAVLVAALMKAEVCLAPARGMRGKPPPVSC